MKSDPVGWGKVVAKEHDKVVKYDIVEPITDPAECHQEKIQ